MQIKKAVSLAMIIKDEEEMLEQCLMSIKDIVDEIIIVDTGSKDNSIAIASKFTDKIFNYEWDNNFSNARNYSIEKCTRDWIFFMDADDYFNPRDKNKFLKLIESSDKEGYFFVTKNYIDLNRKDKYSTNLNIRLIRNKDRYEFVGAIHEQLVEKRNKTLDISLFSTVDISIEHKGYLKAVMEKKQKKERNINILEEELKKDPKNIFMNFNMGNEYLSLENYNKALEYYDISYKNSTEVRGFTHKLLLRMVVCYNELKEFKKAIKFAEEAIKIFPKFTEVYYMLGTIFEKERKYTLAIESYEKAIDIGESSIDIKVINGCGTILAFKALGKIYKNFRDYKKAKINYKKAMEYNKNKLEDYYNFIYCLLKELDNKHLFIDVLKKSEKIGYIQGLIVTNLLIDEGFMDAGIDFVEELSSEKTDHYYFLKGKALFYKNEFENVIKVFKSIEEKSVYFDEALVLEILSKEFIGGYNQEDYKFEKIKDNEIKELIKIIIKSGKDLKEKGDSDLKEEGYLIKAINILDNILKTKRFDYFEKALDVLNYINSEKVLYELGKLYYRNNYKPLATKEILRSWDIYGVIDEESYWVFLSSI